jgi:hypothetical protein
VRLCGDRHSLFNPSYFFFFAGAFLATFFLAGAFFAPFFATAFFLAGAFLATAFFFAGAFLATAFFFAGAFFATFFATTFFLAGAFFATFFLAGAFFLAAFFTAMFSPCVCRPPTGDGMRMPHAHTLLRDIRLLQRMHRASDIKNRIAHDKEQRSDANLDRDADSVNGLANFLWIIRKRLFF